MRGPRRLLWNCAMVGHRPMANAGEDTIFRLDGKKHVGRICKACKCTYFEQINEDEGLIVQV